jgi:hypothetical protein
VHHIANDVRLQIYQGNDDLIKGVQAFVTLDLRTTMLCKARDKHTWDLIELRPIPPTKEPWPGHPPWHWNCRSTLIPLTFSWAELVRRAKGSKAAQLLARRVERNTTAGTRASMNGQVAKDLEYEQWLKDRPQSEQIEALGPGRYDLWKRRKLTFEQMVDQRGNPLTIAQLEAKVSGKSRRH